MRYSITYFLFMFMYKYDTRNHKHTYSTVFIMANFIQIPSTYAPERLELLRQLEKVKEMEISSDANAVKEPGTVH